MLDRSLDERAWRWAGEVRPIDTCERERKGTLVHYPMSAHSSHAFTATGALIVAHSLREGARAPIASGGLGAACFAMGLASFGLWSSRRVALHRVDNWLMEVHLMGVGVATAAASAPAREALLVGLWACYSAWRLATFSGDADLALPSVAYWSAAVVGVLLCGGSGEAWRIVLGIGLVFTGLTLKMVDTTGRGPWGTAAFHYATATGWAVFWSWSQSLPSA